MFREIAEIKFAGRNASGDMVRRNWIVVYTRDLAAAVAEENPAIDVSKLETREEAGRVVCYFYSYGFYTDERGERGIVKDVFKQCGGIHFTQAEAIAAAAQAFAAALEEETEYIS